MTTSVTTRAAGTLNPTRQQLDELDALLQRMLELPVHPLDKPEQTKTEEPAQEPPPPAAILGERPASAGRSNRHQPADTGRSPNTFRLPTAAIPPVAFTVVETASPRPLPPASGFEPRPSMLTPRLVPVTPPPETPASPPPIPEAGEGEMWVPLRSTWQPSASTWPPLAESWHQANSGAQPLAAANPIADSHPNPTPSLPAEPAIIIEKPVSLPAGETETRAGSVSDGKTSVAYASGSFTDAPLALSWPLLPLVWFNQGFDACLAPLGAPGRWLCRRGRVVLGFLGLACLAAAAAIAVNTGMGWSR